MLAEATLDHLREAAIPLLDGEAGDYDPLLQLMDGALVVLLGVASVGSHELFRARAELTKRLIADMGFSSLAIDAASTAMQAIDAYVCGRSDYSEAEDALEVEVLPPTWMWRNAEMLDFLAWLRSYNDQFDSDRHKVRVHSLDRASRDKTVVWAHSRSVGDARATGANVPSLGQLARERFGRRAVLVGFTTYSGTTLTGLNGPPVQQALEVPPADAMESLFHAMHIPHFLVRVRDAPERLTIALRNARVADQFDALIHFDHTRSLEPLEPLAK